MVDSATEQEWAKSKRIETERMKAARALASEQPEQANLAFLDPKTTKVKGWSNDQDVIIASSERMGNRALVFVIGGIALMIIGYAGGLVTSSANLGLGGVIISGFPSGIGAICIGIGSLMSLVVIGTSVAYKVKAKRQFTTSFWTALGSLGLIVLYFLATWLISGLN